MEQEPAAAVRATAAVAVADLAMRFPNMVEPWNKHMYRLLRDQNHAVKYNALIVLTHLILNDMLKVKGQVSHIVMCLEDPNEKIRGLSKMFFQELSKRYAPCVQMLKPSYFAREQAIILDAGPITRFTISYPIL
jgi:condensin complex subunit 1